MLVISMTDFLHAGLLLWGHFHAPKRDADETNYDWLFDMSVKLPHGRALTINDAMYSLATRD